MFQDLILLKMIVLVGFVLLFGGWERIAPFANSELVVRLGHASKRAWQRLMRNIGLFSLNALLSPLIVVPLAALAASFDLGWRPLALQGWEGLAFGILILDLWIYYWHRLNHEWQFLWRFHQVHHLDETLDTSSAFRFHFGEVLLSSLVRALVIALLGISLSSVIIFETVVLACSIFHHSDARIPARIERWLSRLIITPSLHWVHHHAIRKDTDSNYGTLFSFWDRLFRSKSLTRRFAAMPIGVEHMRDRSFLRLLTAPFGAQPRARPRAGENQEPARR